MHFTALAGWLCWGHGRGYRVLLFTTDVPNKNARSDVCVNESVSGLLHPCVRLKCRGKVKGSIGDTYCLHRQHFGGILGVGSLSDGFVSDSAVQSSKRYWVQVQSHCGSMQMVKTGWFEVQLWNTDISKSGFFAELLFENEIFFWQGCVKCWTSYLKDAGWLLVRLEWPAARNDQILRHEL